MIRNRTHARETLAFVFLMSCIVLAFAKCTPERVASSLDVAGHTSALAVCRAEGKEAGSYMVYTKCANEADRKFGLMDGGL